MTLPSTTAPRWAVSGRTHGEVLTAGVSSPGLEIVLLGVPDGFTPAEVEGWLRDLAGVAVETSRGDQRERAIPPLLHHSLTGLLFSQAELWNRIDGPRPCSVAFVEAGGVCAFGWVGEASVQVMVDGILTEPRWVLVRDEEGREARATVFHPAQHVMLTLDYWPLGPDGSQAPASVEAEWAPERPIEVAHAPALEESVEVAAVETGILAPSSSHDLESAETFVIESVVPAELPSHLTQQEQPGLVASEAPLVTEVTEAIAAAEIVEAPEVAEAPEVVEAPRGEHPVGRWLSRMLGWGKREARPAFPAHAPDSEATPLSTYDSLLSDAVAPAEPAPEQTHFELADENVATSISDLKPFEFVPEQSEFASEYATDLVAEPPVSPVTASAPGLAAAGLADVLGFAFAPPVAPPVAPPEPGPAVFAHDDLLRALSESPLRVDHEPVGAADDFAIPPVPGMAAPVIAPVIAPPEPMQLPPVLHVKLTPYVPESQSLAAPIAAEPDHPPTIRIPEVPPVLHVSAPELLAAPPVLRVGVAGDVPAGPPVLRVEAQAMPPQVIVPTPPVAPIAPLAGYAPTFEAQAATAASAAAGADAAAGTTAPLEQEIPAAPPRLPWPAFEELRLEHRPWYRRPQILGAIVLALFGAGWLLGALANPKSDEPNAFSRALRAVGLGGARYQVAVDSSPTGAWIAVDGKDAAKRTPAKLELKPGKHTLTLTLPELGAASVEVNGQNGESVTLNPSLNGALEILPADPGVPISVSLDGRPQGYAPITIESLAPGLHEVQFSGPGMAPWAQTIQIGVRKTAQLLARPMSAPGTGVLQIQATLSDETGSSPLTGAQVFVDGVSRGNTPLSLELPRGPHSIRVSWHSETAPVQVIDLPGGNQRFASFSFGLDTPSPQITIPASSRTMSASQTNMISAAFSGLTARDMREAWLHVRTAEGLWRRYAMTPVTGPGVFMMAAVFPPGVFDATGRTSWYVSATTAQGDEYFSEMQPANLESARAARPAAKPDATP